MGVIQLGQRNIRPHVSPRNGLAVHAKLPSYSKIELNECHISPFYRRYISQRLRIIAKAGTDDNADIIDDDDLETEQEDDILEDDIDFNDSDDLIDIDGTCETSISRNISKSENNHSPFPQTPVPLSLPKHLILFCCYPTTSHPNISSQQMTSIASLKN